MMPAERIDRDWIAQHAGTTLMLHANMGDRHLLARRVVDKRTGAAIGLSYTDVSFKRTRRNGERGGTSQRTWTVDTHPDNVATLDEALELLAIVRIGDDPDRPGPPTGPGGRPDAAPRTDPDAQAVRAADVSAPFGRPVETSRMRDGARGRKPETHHV